MPDLLCPHGGGPAHLIADVLAWLSCCGGLVMGIKIWWRGQQ